MKLPLNFEVSASDGDARAGLLETPHGVVRTPTFMSVATFGAVRGVSIRDLDALGAQILLANTYHLHERPGEDIVESQGGLHGFTGWRKPWLTDSGGYQVTSLADRVKVDEEGITFASPLDGKRRLLTPERAIEIQEALGPDIAMVLDECPDPLDRDYNIQALDRTHRWAERCKTAHTRVNQALFGIVQGGVFPDLRQQSAEFLTRLDFEGYAVGGLAVGETKEEMYATLDETCPALPTDKPRYLMGVGAPEDVVEAVARGVDMFDCVLPTRIARNASLLTPDGRVNMKNARFADDRLPVQEDCGCYTCRTFSRAYLRHLYKAKEVTALRLGTIHNVHFMLELMRQIRQAIAEGEFESFRHQFLERYQISNQKVRHEQRAKRRASMRG
jgi:queuine tRNA-ribosyltransferase